jgi:hypothetical protein
MSNAIGIVGRVFDADQPCSACAQEFAIDNQGSSQ